MDCLPSVATRTRSRKFLNGVAVSDTKTRIGTRTVRIGKNFCRNSKGFSRGVRVRVFRSQQKLGFTEKKGARKFAVAIEEAKGGRDRISTAVGCMARGTRLRRGVENDLPSFAGNAASTDSGKFGRSLSQETVETGFESGGLDCSGGLEAEGTVEGGAAVRFSSSKLRFGDERSEGLGKCMDWEGSEKEKKDGFGSIGGMEAVNSCVAKRTRSRSGSGKAHQTVSDPVPIDLDELQSSSSSDDDDEPLLSNLDKLHSSSSSSSLSSLSDDENDDADGGSGDGGGGDGVPVGVESSSYSSGNEGQFDGTCLKTMRYSGLVFVVSGHNEAGSSGGAYSKTAGIAQRTRSHRPSVPEKNLGTVSNPIDLDLDSEPLPRAAAADAAADDVDDDEDNDGDDDDVKSGNGYTMDGDVESNDGDDEIMYDAGGGENVVGGKEEREGQEEPRFGKSTKRKRVRALKNDSLFKLLVDTIWEKGEKLPKELDPLKERSPPKNVKVPKGEMPLPLKFSFRNEEPEQKEKSELEKFEDDLWAEFNFVMQSNDIGSFTNHGVETEESNVPEFETDPSNLCLQGKHQFILDEEIGIKCRFCPFLKLEIKYILPSMATNSSGKLGKRDSVVDGDLFMFDRLRSQSTNNESQCSFVPSEGTVWDIVPGIKRTMYPHQQEGFEFMWKNLAGSIDLEELKKSASPDGLGGCVISHAPGTGKTRLAIVFLQTFMEVFPKCRPIILAPRSMLLTWEREFSKWNVDIPIHVLNKKEFSGKEDSLAVGLGHNKRQNWVRLVKIFSWDKGGSILGLSYSLFEKLVGNSNMHDKEHAEISKILREKTGLLVLDEGHTPRNERSLIWKALEKLKTDRRIILSGTPFQNNFRELYNTLCLVRPKFADKLSSKTSEMCQRRSEMLPDDVHKVLHEKRDGKGKWASLTNSIGKITDDNLEKLRSMMDPFVHVHKGSILNSLPGLRDCVVVLHPLPLQKLILERFEKVAFETHFQEEYNTSLISVHPSLLVECSLPEKQEPIIDQDLLERLRLSPNDGVKTRFVMELVRLSEAMNERVLIFSQYIEPLSFLKEHLKSLFSWTEGKEVLQMDGSVPIKRRQSSIDSFNDPASEARVLLASTKACSEGINLIGASRVVLLDVVWNPSVERQAISRAYRIGQSKVVYTYHLITSGTREGDKYYRQAEKDRLSELLFSSTEGDAHKPPNSSKVSEDKILEEMVGHDKLKIMFEKILYQPRKSSLVDGLGPAALR
ncbi:SNF2 domain-containing protein CLASSY 3-like [Magnolia sinica]|uniref:SNF2 domain-containing protein CLASSY 3-like n=1 Tax=Magnolia sinica TaxID=86752 RepID=UPI002658D700|nr:SNF2 domain-containing protein CLASSY 3-like [Magnolia sinica]